MYFGIAPYLHFVILLVPQIKFVYLEFYFYMKSLKAVFSLVGQKFVLLIYLSDVIFFNIWPFPYINVIAEP